MPEQLIKGFFVGIPEKTLLSKEWKGLQATTRCIYIAMLMRYKRKGKTAGLEVEWSYNELSYTTGFSRRTIRRGIQELRDKEWIKVLEPGGRWTRGTRYEVTPSYANGTNKSPKHT